jgi:hypothetical protein
MSSFNDLKKASKQSIDDLVKASQAASGEKKSYGDDNLWKPTRDKAGNGYAVIRFLPAPDTPTPWVQYWDHFFKGPSGRWYVEKSLTTLKQDDPVSEVNSELWNREGSEYEVKANQEIVRSRKRKLHYVANIQVITDKNAPENDGKVFKYDFGAKIFGKIVGAMQPEFPDQEPMNPFDIFNGAPFTLRIKKVEGYPNYDQSSFGTVEPLDGGDEDKMKATWEKCHKIGEYVDPSTFKPYAELKAKLEQVLGTAANADDVIESAAAETMKSVDSRPTFGESSDPLDEPVDVPSEGADEDIAFFDTVIDD